MDTNSKSAGEALAQGMSNIYDTVDTATASAIKQELQDHFGKGLYYRMKSGEKNITPEQQHYIAETFSRHGVDAPPVYDRMVTA